MVTAMGGATGGMGVQRTPTFVVCTPQGDTTQFCFLYN